MPEEDTLDEELQQMQDAEKESPAESESTATEESTDAPEKPDESEQATEQAEEQEAQKEVIEATDSAESVPLAVALEWKRQGKELTRQVSELQSQIKTLAGSINQPQQPEEQAPDINENPVEYLAFQQRQQSKMIEDLQKALQDSTARGQQHIVQTEVNAIEQQFAAKTADYYDATRFLTEHRLNELQNLYGFTEEQAQARFAEETARFIDTATAQGESFAEKAYRLAASLGYKAKSAAAETPAKAGDSLKDLARKQANAKTLAGASGKAPETDLTIGDAAELSNDEFDAQFTGEAGDKRLREMFGG